MIAARTFDFALVCDADQMGQPAPWKDAVVAREGRFTLIRIR
jgi:hypothetical protein